MGIECGELSIFTGWLWLGLGVLAGMFLMALMTMARDKGERNGF